MSEDDISERIRRRDLAAAEQYLMRFVEGLPIEQWDVLRSLALLAAADRGYLPAGGDAA